MWWCLVRKCSKHKNAEIWISLGCMCIRTFFPPSPKYLFRNTANCPQFPQISNSNGGEEGVRASPTFSVPCIAIVFSSSDLPSLILEVVHSGKNERSYTNRDNRRSSEVSVHTQDDTCSSIHQTYLRRFVSILHFRLHIH